MFFTDFDRNKVVEIFKKFKFKSILPKLNDIFGKQETFVPTSQLDIFSAPPAVEIQDIKQGSQEDFNTNIKDSKELVIAYIREDESLDGKSFYVCRFKKEKEDLDITFENLDFSTLKNSEMITFFL